MTPLDVLLKARVGVSRVWPVDCIWWWQVRGEMVVLKTCLNNNNKCTYKLIIVSAYGGVKMGVNRFAGQSSCLNFVNPRPQPFLTLSCSL